MADKELFRVRIEFVERVTDELLKQLLDDLLGDGVLNQGQRKSILQGNPITTDKARDLIDTVRMKGDKASRKMIAHIHSRDLMLYSELGLTCGEPAQPAAEPQMKAAEPQMKAAGPQMKAAGPQMKAAEPQMKAAGPQKKQEWSTALLRTPKEFWENKLNDSDVYPAAKKSIRNRVALLITNITFTDERLNRKGAEKDEEDTEKLLIGLGYEVVKYTNLTGKAIDDAVIKFSKHEKLRETDSVVVVIMSHGKPEAVLGVNWTKEKSDEFPINNLYKHLDTENCPALRHKPKIIIIQACRGEDKGSVLVKDGAGQDVACDDVVQQGDMDDIEEDTLEFVNKEQHLIAFLSCTPDTVSYRHPVNGSLLIQYIVDVFFTFAHKEQIEELFRIVMRRFEDFSVRQKGRQMPTKDRVTLTKKFYFFPGI